MSSKSISFDPFAQFDIPSTTAPTSTTTTNVTTTALATMPKNAQLSLPATSGTDCDTNWAVWDKEPTTDERWADDESCWKTSDPTTSQSAIATLLPPPPSHTTPQTLRSYGDATTTKCDDFFNQCLRAFAIPQSTMTAKTPLKAPTPSSTIGQSKFPGTPKRLIDPQPSHTRDVEDARQAAARASFFDNIVRQRQIISMAQDNQYTLDKKDPFHKSYERLATIDALERLYARNFDAQKTLIDTSRKYVDLCALFRVREINFSVNTLKISTHLQPIYVRDGDSSASQASDIRTRLGSYVDQLTRLVDHPNVLRMTSAPNILGGTLTLTDQMGQSSTYTIVVEHRGSEYIYLLFDPQGGASARHPGAYGIFFRGPGAREEFLNYLMLLPNSKNTSRSTMEILYLPKKT